MTPPPEAISAATRAFAGGLKMPDVLRRAGVSRATWWRIRRGEDFYKSTIERIEQAIADLIAERAA